MDYSTDQQHQAFDPSAYQIQAHDPSAASYYGYAYPQYAGNVPQQYSHYSYTVQPQQQQVQQEPRPPGVSDPSLRAQMYYYHNQYYHQHAAVVNVERHHGGISAGVPAQQPIVQPSYKGISRIDGRPPNPGRHGRSGHNPSYTRRPSRGRGRDRGHNPRIPPKHAAAPALALARGQTSAAPVLPPPRVAWCELCRVDCNTPEILQIHKQGKKHLKNLKAHAERNKRLVRGQMPQASGSELISEVPPRPIPVPGYIEMTIQAEALPDPTIDDGAAKRKVEDVEPSVGPAKKPRMDSLASRGRELRHKIRGGKSGNRVHHESRIPTEPRKPKEVIPLICELCNIKCDTAAVFQCHLTGKKHLSKAKSFLSQNEILGQEVLKALSPAILSLLRNAANASASVAPQLPHQGLIPFQGAFGLNANAMNLNPQAPQIYPENAEAEAMDQPLSFSTNSGGGNHVSVVGNVNEKRSESGTESVNPAPASLTVAQAVRVAACTAFATSGAATDVGSIFQNRAVVQPSYQNAHPQ